MEPFDALGDDPAPGRGELEQIVARAGKRRWRLLVACTAVALAGGGGIGYAVSNHSSPGQTVVAGAPNDSSGTATQAPAAGLGGAASGTSKGGGTVSGGIAVPAPNAEKFSPLFRRTTGDITIRGFLTSFHPVMRATPAICFSGPLGPQLEAEVSTPGMVATTVAFGSGSTAAIRAVQSTIVGVAEGDPTLVVAVQTAPSVTSLKFAGANHRGDQMTPVQGWSVLATPASTSSSDLTTLGTLTALASNGKVSGTTTVRQGALPVPSPRPDVACGCPGVANGGVVNGGPATAGPAIACPMIRNSTPPGAGVVPQTAPAGNANPAGG